MQEVADVDAFVAAHRPDWTSVRWINVDGLSDLGAVRALAVKYDLHPLAIEDVLHVSQRPKMTPTTPTPSTRRGSSSSCACCSSSRTGWRPSRCRSSSVTRRCSPSRRRPGTSGTRSGRGLHARARGCARTTPASSPYTLIDAIVDHCFPILEHYGDRLEELEDSILERRRSVIQGAHPQARAAAAAPRPLADARGGQHPAARAARVHVGPDPRPTCATSTTTRCRSSTSSRPTARWPRP